MEAAAGKRSATGDEGEKAGRKEAVAAECAVRRRRRAERGGRR